MADIILTARTNASQTSVIIIDGGSSDLNSFTSMILSFRKNEVSATPFTYTLSESEVEEYRVSGSVEISFLDMPCFATSTIGDAMWAITASANAGAYTTGGYFWLGIYVDITFVVMSLLNSVHVPENRKSAVDDLFNLFILLNRLKFLDTSSINDRETKFQKTLNALNKLTGVTS